MLAFPLSLAQVWRRAMFQLSGLYCRPPMLTACTCIGFLHTWGILCSQQLDPKQPQPCIQKQSSPVYICMYTYLYIYICMWNPTCILNVAILSLILMAQHMCMYHSPVDQTAQDHIVFVQYMAAMVPRENL